MKISSMKLGICCEPENTAFELSLLLNLQKSYLFKWFYKHECLQVFDSPLTMHMGIWELSF